MKKTNLIICILLFLSILILVFSVIDIRKERSLMEYSNDISFNKDSLIAVAFLNDSLDYKNYLHDYDNIKIYQISSDETYLIIPKYKDTKINVYETTNEDDKKDRLVNSTNKPFVITCNKDNISNIVLEVIYKDTTFEYSPLLKQGKVIVNKYVTDITKYNVE